MNDHERAARQLDRAIDRYAEKIGFRTMELLLQNRAQTMRQLAVENGEETITVADIDEIDESEFQ